MTRTIRQSDLEGYVDEALPPKDMAEIELAMRDDPELLRQMAALLSRRGAGVHSLGEIWRQGRLSCPGRDQLGSYLLDALPEELAAYVRFHIEDVGCRYCQANLSDLKSQQAEHDAATQNRRRRYYESSAGYLRRND